MFNLENMNEYEQYSYLTDMCDPYISYEVINGELKKIFKDGTPDIIYKAQEKIESLISSPSFELPR